MLGYKQHVTSPTHVHGGWLDIVLTPADLSLENLKVLDETGTKSDHFMIIFNVECAVEQPNVSWVEKDYRNYDNIVHDDLKADILNSPLCDSSSFSDLNSSVDAYNHFLKQLLDKHAPARRKFFRNDLDLWWNADCQRSRKLRRKAERRYKKSKTPQNRKLYKLSCIKTARVIDAVRNRYYKQKIENADPKQKHALIKQLLGNSTQHNMPYCSGDDLEMAEKFQSYSNDKVNGIYENVKAQQDTSPKLSMQSSSCSTSKSSFQEISYETLFDVVSSMTTKTCALDPVPTWLVKKYLLELSPILLHIVNLSLTTGEFPTDLKTSIVTPILKGSGMNSDEMKSYRPVSNLSFLSKIIEKCVHKQLMEYLNENNLLSDVQSGYRKNHSCETAITRIHNDLLSFPDKTPHNALLILLDLSAAFDTLNHELLLKILKDTYGLTDTVLLWFQSYLSMRSFKVKIKRTLSGKCFVTIGIPQGSILGPLLFILFTKDLQLVASKHGFMFHCYADDCQIYLCFEALSETSDSVVQRLEACLSDIKSWMTWHFLKLNEGKTEALSLHPFYGQSQLVDEIYFNDTVIATSPTAKSLGVHFDSKLSFQKQASEVVQTCNYRLKNMIRIGSKLQPDVKQMIFQSYIMNKLDYCNSVYGGINQSVINKLQSVQNAGARFVKGMFGRDWRQRGSMHDLLSTLHYLPVYYRILFKICLLTFKCIHGLAPKYLQELISISQPSAHYSMRRNCDRFRLETLDKPRYQKMESAFQYISPTTWNNLPYEIRSITEILKFKVALKTHFYTLAFAYSSEF